MLKSSTIFVCLSAVALGGCVGEDTAPQLGTRGMAVQVIPEGTSCAAQGLGSQEFVIQDPVDGVYAIDAGNTLLFRYYDATNTVFFYTNSSIRMDGVLVHASNGTTVWELDGANGWPSLGAIDTTTGEYLPPGSVSFCFDYELFLNPNGYAHYGQRQGWDITKTGYEASILLAAGSSFMAPYTVTVTPTITTPTSLFIEGPVFINNPTPYTPRIDAVTVMVGELPATVTCPVALPYVLPAFTTLTCTFTVDVPDTEDRLIYVDVASDGTVGIDRSLELADFDSHTTSTELFDDCVAVYDDHVPGGFLGTACAADGATSFDYTAEVGPYEVCGPFEVTNTARFEGLDSGTGGSASWVVGGEVPCEDGCTLTPGYWKTHSEHGPARYDATWSLLYDGANTPFFLSGTSYYRVLQTSPAGNAYYILAHAFIAAELNRLNGASFDAAADAFAEAYRMFVFYAPSDPELGKKTLLRAQFIQLAAALDAYNNGVTGPGHCTE